MKKCMLFLAIAAASYAHAQIGLKAGLNFANVTNASSIGNSSRTGFNIAAFLAPHSKSIFSSRTELIFSQQGYNYASSTNTGDVNLQYIMLPQYLCINITKYVQLQLGAQAAFLINAKADSSKATTSSPANPYSKMLDYYNRFDYGYGGGIEIYPVKGLLIGARMNVSLGNLYKDMGSYTPGSTPQQASFVPTINVKNNVLQLYLGWKFGKR